MTALTTDTSRWPVLACSNGACGVGSGGMEQNSKIPYAEQASLEIDRQFGGGFALSLSYLMVEAHHMVRGNNINIPCPVGTTKSGRAYRSVDDIPWRASGVGARTGER